MQKKLKNGLWAIGFLAITGCGQNQNDNEIQPSIKPLFTKVNQVDSGIDFQNKIDDTKEHNILLYSNYYGGGGVGIGDFNGDGLKDVYFAGNLVPDRLYINKGNMQFEDATEASGITYHNGWSTGVSIADVNNDGAIDIYVTRELYDHEPERRKNLLYVNNGDGTFTEKATEYGIADPARSRHATFFDYDNDGFLDLFVLNQPPNPGSYSEFFGTPLLQNKYSSKLYRNIKGAYFEDVTEKAGLLRPGFPNAASTSDFNGDGWADIYVANDFYAPDALYINNQDGTFTNTIHESFNHISYFSMGVDAADLNNDGLLDLHVLDMAAEDNYRSKSNMSGMDISQFWRIVNRGGHYQYMFNNVHLNNGNNTFSEIAQLTNMATTDWSWANLIADFDNDGYKDVFITNGLLRDIRNTDSDKAVANHVNQVADTWVKNNPNGGEISIWEILDLQETLSLVPSEKLVNYMYQNQGDYQFENVIEKWGLNDPSFSNGAAYADLDNDGDLDLIVNNINEPAFVYRNNSTNNFVRFSLKSKSNQPVLNSKITLYLKEQQQFVELTNTRGIYSTSEQHSAHFGLGENSRIDSVRIQWPNGKSTIFAQPKSNKEHVLYLEDAIEVSRINQHKAKSLMKESNFLLTDSEHKENVFDDFSKQILLPHKMSQFGPAMAIGDVNGDGLDDVFLGASVGETSQLWIQGKNTKFKTKFNQSFSRSKFQEDIDAAFVDIDNDNDLDLYVVSGGNEFIAGNANYTDRLYLNDGKGNFKATGVAPESKQISGSVVRFEDFDGNGFLDAFVGGRHTPQQYPVPTDSKIYRNNGGKLSDVTAEVAPELVNLGMVTDALWTDYDNDGDKDLMVVGEWMPITILENTNGKFKKVALSNLKDTAGWWFSIEQGDFDKDGDMDYVVGNLGLNYKYKTSPEEPFDVHYYDFDNSGQKDIVLGYYNYGEHYPLRGFSCSSEQVPELKSKFKKYDVFASLNLEEVYGQDKLSNALHYQAHTFASLFVENLGNGNFRVHELPRLAQLSNINDFIVDDFDNDGNLDVLAAGNLYVSEIETTRNDAGRGVLLFGDGKNNFSPVSHLTSGFFANKDVRKLKPIQLANGKKAVVVANNNGPLQFFEFNAPEK
ncbi:FG-GAP-like repeat-containing protein [Sediminicola luteus]|uniref:ASPIC/UnbV domain-containing protein n=1 Tax=Sediminicola luteus TaxID=319238 RepID=A0A2A4G6M6_9FLAO|nr:FG-GAP-like repeat-containing protein [Sediminicola luteus]PCE63638.1 hypothetical protein B7P33_10155 [Sediminicola luteus]